MAKKVSSKAQPGRSDRNKKVPVTVAKLRKWRKQLQAIDEDLEGHISAMKSGGIDSFQAVPNGISSAIEIIETKMVTQIEPGIKKAIIEAGKRAIDEE